MFGRGEFIRKKSRSGVSGPEKWQRMFADPEIPVRMTDPFHVEIVLEPKLQIEIVSSQQLVEDSSVIDPLDSLLAAIEIVKQLPAALLDLCDANRADA